MKKIAQAVLDNIGGLVGFPRYATWTYPKWVEERGAVHGLYLGQLILTVGLITLWYFRCEVSAVSQVDLWLRSHLASVHCLRYVNAFFNWAVEFAASRVARYLAETARGDSGVSLGSACSELSGK